MTSQRMRTVLIIAYELPPSAGGGVQRIAKFLRYLPDHGWDVRVVCAEPIPGRPRDEALVEQIRHAHITRVRPRNLAVAIARAIGPFKRLAGRGGAGGDGPVERSSAACSRPPISSRVARWLTLPDETAPWIRSAVRAALESAREHQVDVVLATAPPFSALVAGERVAGRLGVPFVADMRDSWRDNSSFAWPTRWHRRRAERIEQRLMRAAALVTAASSGIAAEAEEMGARHTSELPNGFDPSDVPHWSPEARDGFHVVFIGRLYAGVSDPATFFDALVTLWERQALPSGLRVTFIGPRTPWSVAMAEARGLGSIVTFKDFLPYREAIAEVAAADAGLIITATGPGARAMYPGKLFDYLGVGIPILMAGAPDGVAAELVREAGVGVVADYADPAAIADALLALVAAKERGAAGAGRVPDVVARYDRQAQVARLAHLLDDLAGHTDA